MTISAERSPAARTSSPRRAPDFFIVGHPKCGTTALHEMLRRHSQIYMPEMKEPRFFACDMYPRSQSRTSAGLPDTLEEYLSLFDAAKPEQRAGEASPLYLVSRTAAREIADIQPAARVIAIMREPASFLRSLHLQLLQSHLETKKDLRRAISLEDARRRGKRIPRTSRLRPQILHYSDYVRYVEQLRRYEAVFPPEQVLVLIYEDFRRDNEATVRRLLRFLGVDYTPSVDVKEANPTVRVRSQQLDGLVHAVSVGRGPLARAMKAPVKALVPRGLRRRALSGAQRHVVHGDARLPDQALMMELRRRFKGEVVALSEYLCRDLVALWGYDVVS